MKIRTQLLIMATIFGVALLVIAASVVNTSQQIERLNQQQELVKNIELKTNELSYLSNDYILFQEPLQIDRWGSKYASISADVSNLSVDRPDQQVLVNNIKTNQHRLKDIFDDIVYRVESQPEGEQDLSPAFVQVSWSRISVQTQGTVFDASRLSQKLHDEENHLNMVNNMLILILIGTFAIFLLINYLLIFRRTLKSISDLQAGTRIVGSGNLSYSIDDRGDDELGELSRAFNTMAARLKTVTASKADLEKEIAERQRVEAALQVKHEELESQAEELKVQTDELLVKNLELEKVTVRLRESEEKYRTIVETAGEGIWVVDSLGKTTYVNRRLTEMLGYSPEEMAGRPAKDFTVEIGKGASYNLEKDLYGIQEKAEFMLIRKDGTPLWAIISARPLFDRDGRFEGTLSMLTDITDRKLAEQELAIAKAQAELYLDLMGHDISNMHQIAIAHLEMAQEIIENEKLPAEYRQMIEIPLATLLRSARLINNVRKLQQLQAGLYKPEAFDLCELMDDIVKEYATYPGKDVAITLDAPRECFTTANPLLKDVFTNLLDNAIKHSGDRPNIRITLGKSEDGRFYRVAVEDHGSGITDSRKDEVFVRFRRGETTARGTGLGLYLVRTLVESFGGSVSVEDRVPGDHTMGTRFVVLLPVVEPTPEGGRAITE